MRAPGEPHASCRSGAVAWAAADGGVGTKEYPEAPCAPCGGGGHDEGEVHISAVRSRSAWVVTVHHPPGDDQALPLARGLARDMLERYG